MSPQVQQLEEATSAADAAAHTVRVETQRAFANGVKLALSLVSTLAVAIGVRFWLPRVLGPEIFGQSHFSENFAAGWFAFTHLGAETYISREVAVRRECASEFFGGLLLARAAASMIVLAGIAGTLLAMGKPQLEWEMVYIFAAGQLLYVLNGSLAAMLQAVGKVDELAVSNFAAKILWAVGIVGGVALGGGVRMVAVAFLASEALRSWSLLRSARRHVGLRIHLELAGLKPILLICLPYMLHTIAHRIYATIDVTMLSWLTTDEEVGWYGAAISLMMLALMIIPVFQAVILPMGARIGQTSTVALNETMRAAVRLTLMFSAPLSLLLALDADAIVQTVYRESYAPSVGSLRVLGLLIPITCALTVGASQLLQHGRVWTLTKISIVAMVFNPTVNYLFIPWGLHHWGKGGGGLAAAIATVGTEVLVALLTFGALGREAWDRATARLLATLAGLAAVVVGLHFALPPFGIGKLFVEAAVYVALAMPLGALPLVDLANRILQRLAARRAARRG